MRITFDISPEEMEELKKTGSIIVPFSGVQQSMAIHGSDIVFVKVLSVVRTERNAEGQRDFLFEFVRAKA